MAKEKAVRRHKRCARRRMGLRKFVKSFPPFLIILSLAIPVLAGQAGEKLAGGIEDAATGWVEVPREMVETTENTNIVVGATVGTVKGAGEAIVKTTKGVVDVATFYIPDKNERE